MNGVGKVGKVGKGMVGVLGKLVAAGVWKPAVHPGVDMLQGIRFDTTSKCFGDDGLETGRRRGGKGAGQRSVLCENGVGMVHGSGVMPGQIPWNKEGRSIVLLFCCCVAWSVGMGYVCVRMICPM